MKKLLFVLMVAGLFSFPVHANHIAGHAAVHNITVSVHGLVCDFCARALEKVFYKQAGVEAVDVDLDTHLVTLGVTDDMKLTDDEISKLIADAGYNPVEIKREQ
jgi:copper chaperone CopZ